MQYGDCHIHIFMDGVDYPAAVRRHQETPDEEDIRKHLAVYRDMGVTYLRDGGDHYGSSVLARKLAPEYDIEYRTPIYGIFRKGCYGRVVGQGFETIGEYRTLVDGVAAAQGDFIKIMASGILDFDVFGEVSTADIPEELIREMVHIAHESGFAVMVHVNTPRQILASLEAGCDSIEHGYYLDDACIEKFLETKAVWVPTVSTCANLIGSGRFREDTVRKITESHMGNIRRCIEAGVLIAPGSDAGAYRVPHGEGLSSELALLKLSCGGDADLEAKLDQLLAEGFAKIRKTFRRA